MSVSKRPSRWLLALLAVVAGTFAATPLAAVSTEVTVRVISKDAKFVGTSMGGVLVTLRDADTGRLLAEGLTAGGTGDTQKIMVDAHKRGAVLSTPDAAAFTATLDLDRPTLLEVTAFGPQGQRQSANRVSITQWVVPGKHLNGGDGLLLELPGLVVDVLAPAAHSTHAGLPKTLDIAANVTMMCGCPLTPGGLWDSNKFEVRGLVRRDGQLVDSLGFALGYAGTASQFAGQLTVDQPGTYEVTVYAYDAASGNTGLDRVTFMVRP